MKQFHNFIGGEFVATTKTFPNRAPVDNRVIGLVHEAGATEVDAAVHAARKALRGDWGRMSVVKRVEMLHAVADEINRRFDDFLQAEIADTGKPLSLASHVDIPRGAANFKVFADIVKNVPTESFEMTTPDGGTALSYALRSPLGVVAVVCPWNLPLLLMTWKVGPALACGNTVIVKPSEETPATATLLGEVMNAVGVPPGVYNVVHGFGPGSAGEFLTRHRGVDGITFTGETRTGEAIMAAAAKGVRPVSFELGGKNAGIVFADADFDKAVAGITRSAFENCGQVCLGTERVYVQRPIFDKFVAALAAKAEALKVGPSEEPGVSLGPLISAEHRQKVLSYYAKARAEGATVVTGGGVPAMPGPLAEGHWVQPTIWTGLPETASVIREEIFGPCCHIAPFDTEDEAIALANATDYGLATTVWTQSLSTAHRAAREIEVGLCWVNSWFLRDLRTAFGGAKASGIGREGGVHSLEFYTELRNVMVKLYTAMSNPELGKRVRTGAFDTNVHDSGSGAPVLLIHGSGPGVSAWANWRLVLPALAAARRVIAPDMVGFGYSDRPPGQRYDMDVWVQQALDLLDALDVERADLVGNSFGGALALALAIKAPQRVRRLVLMGSVGVPFTITPGLDAVWGYEPSLAAMRALLDIFAFDRALATDELAQLRYEASIRPGFQESFAAMFLAPRQASVDAMASTEADIRALPHETLVIHGREDRVIPLQNSLTLSAWIPNSQLHVFGHCGHWTQIEHSARFNRLVDNFLAEADDTPART